MEGIALTGAWVDREQGLLSLIALEMGVSSRLCAYLKPGEPVVVMGPTGTPTEIPENDDGAARRRRPRQRRAVLDRQGAQGAAATASSTSPATRTARDLFKREEIEAATDQVIWATDAGDAIAPRRPQDAHFRGNIVAGDGRLRRRASWATQTRAAARTSTRIIAIGSDRMMDAVRAGAPRRAAAAPRPEPRRHRQHQLADAVHDEGGLRAVPAAPRRSRRPAARSSSSPATTRTRSSTASTSTTCRRGCGRTACRRSSRTCGSSTCSIRPNPSWFTYKLGSRAVARDRGIDDRYEISTPLGSGGMGQVYRARRVRLGDEVAIKVMQATPTTRRRSCASGSCARAAPAPSCATPTSSASSTSASTPASQPYMVMELLSGPSLREEIELEAPMAPARVAVDPRRRWPRALQLAHDRGITHRDLKPANIVAHRYESGERVYKVIDFGLAAMKATSDETRLTDPALFLGTMAYAAPEQMRGDAVTPATDIYALGVIAYEMLTGARPFDAAQPGDADQPDADDGAGRAPAVRRSGLPRGDRRRGDAALGKDPAERWPTVTGVRRRRCERRSAQSPAPAGRPSETRAAVALRARRAARPRPARQRRSTAARIARSACRWPSAC